MFASSSDLLFGSHAGRLQAKTPLTSLSRFAEPPLTDGLGAGDDLYEAVKRILADRSILIGDREKLAAANDDPCGPVKD